MPIIKVKSPTYGVKRILVDEKDYDFMKCINWRVNRAGNTFYARNEKYGLMHRYILEINDSKVLVDHKDHNGLNNQRHNLRIGNRSNNNWNTSSHKNSTSNFLGVCWHNPVQKRTNKDGDIIRYSSFPNRGKWVASIGVNKKTKFLGYYENEIDAAQAYDKAAKKLFGCWANLNFK